MKFLILKKHTLTITVLAIILCSVLCLSFGENSAASVFFGDNLKKVPIYSVQTEENKVAISFDTAWGADKTQGIIDTLIEYKVGATFFMVGFWVEDYPEQAKAVADAGFEIGTHSDTHPDMVKLSASQMTAELQSSMDKIQSTTGVTPTLFRAPYGSYNNLLLDTADSLGLTTIQWSIDSWDWQGLSASEICNRIISRVTNGSIILCHNNAEHILEALPLILDELQMRGYTVVGIEDLIYPDNYTVDRAGVQKQN